MSRARPDQPLVVVVGSGGVGKTTIAAVLGLASAKAGRDTLVMTFDPSLRLKDALGVGDAARDREVPVAVRAAGALHASLLDARRTFDRLVERHAPDRAARERILGNRFYHHLAGSLAGVLEYMAVERLFEVAADDRYQQVILDTPPTRQALDFLRAPERIIGFLDSGALRIALKPWFDERGHLRPVARLGVLGRNVEGFLDRLVGLDLLRDMAEFFQAFAPLYAGFRDRARQVQQLLVSRRTLFVLVSGPGRERVADTLFFARHLREAGHHLGPMIVNRVHPRSGRRAPEVTDPAATARDGRQLLAWLGQRDHEGVDHLRSLLTADQPLVALPLQAEEPATLDALGELAELLQHGLAEAGA